MDKNIQQTLNNDKSEIQRNNYKDEKRVSEKKKNPCDGCYGASNSQSTHHL